MIYISPNQRKHILLKINEGKNNIFYLFNYIMAKIDKKGKITFQNIRLK